MGTWYEEKDQKNWKTKTDFEIPTPKEFFKKEIDKEKVNVALKN